MKVLSNGKVKRTAAEWREIIERCERSGLSRQAFCTKNKIAKASFDKWKGRLSKMSDPLASSFVEIPVSRDAPTSGAATPGGEFELSFPGGVVLRWKP
jgi:hypothetical protein